MITQNLKTGITRSTKMTRDEAYSIISELNEEAHSSTWDSWVEADELGESDEEEDWAMAEERREEASEEQSGFFRVEFGNLKEEQQDAIWSWAMKDEDFAEDMKGWYGQTEFDEYIAE
jgi:hypothetical protein